MLVLTGLKLDCFVSIVDKFFGFGLIGGGGPFDMLDVIFFKDTSCNIMQLTSHDSSIVVAVEIPVVAKAINSSNTLVKNPRQCKK
jgi:hypothetical protein